MSRYNHRHNLSAREYLYRILFSLFAIAVLVVFMPRGTTSAYHYQLGEPWDEDAFIAQDSFPILKSAEQIIREQDSLRQFYEPYFRQDVDILEQQSAALKQDFSSLPMQGIPYYYQPHLRDKLNHIYQVGILSAEDMAHFENEKPEMVRVYHDNESNWRSFSQLFTEKTAYEYLVHEEDSARFSHSRLHGLDLMKYVKPNLTYDSEKSQQQRQEVDSRLVRTKGVVLQGQKVVDRGQIVDEEVMGILHSWEQHQKEHTLTTKERLTRFGGRIAYVAILTCLLLIYFQQFRSDYLDSLRTVLLVMTFFLIFPIITYTIMAHMWASVYLVPYCVLPIVLRIFLDSRTAFVTHVITILASSIVLTQPFPFIVTQLVAGLVAIYSLRELSQRSELFRAAVWVTITTLLTYLCLEFVRGTADGGQVMSRWPYIYLMVAGVLSMLVYLLLIPIERIFGFTSIVTLVELQNVNNPLLRRLSEEANGTFNHSLQVANLAAEVANRLGARAQLVRTGALYHDIGKLENAVFFTENQNGQNPHDGLSYERSAQIIIQHVANGMKLADRYKLPSVVRDFIATHHGKSLTKYFYVKAMETTPSLSSEREASFRYPGPKPQTLEQAILMMTDAVEAASRSLTEYTEESISALVEKIVGAQVSEGSFNECAITFRQIAEAKEVLCARLRTVYHTRIQYPE
ncbi:MAG: HDIG domain-containing protein [Bacteroidaceae bacterium]|nr:HDIG domain-containing protein [Bacteroidaceae bacterium]